LLKIQIPTAWCEWCVLYCLGEQHNTLGGRRKRKTHSNERIWGCYN